MIGDKKKRAFPRGRSPRRRMESESGVITVRLSGTQYNEIIDRAKKGGVSMEQYIRDQLFHVSVDCDQGVVQ